MHVFFRKLVNNHTFFQHPDLIRVLRVHENVMAVMINTLGRRSQAQSDASQAGQEGEPAAKEKVIVINKPSHIFGLHLFSFWYYFYFTI